VVLVAMIPGHCDLGDLGKLFAGQVGGDFQEYRDRGGQGGAGFHHALKEGGKGGGSLKVAQFLGVRGGDVHGREIDMRAAARQDPGKVGGAVVAGLVRAKVQADRNGGSAASGKAGGNHLHPVVVEAEAVDRRAVLGQTEQAWLGVAGLRQGGGGTDLQKPEARAAEGADYRGVLVIACRKAHRVQKRHAGQCAGEARQGYGAGQGGEAGLQGDQRKGMGTLGVYPLQQGEARAFRQAHHTPSGKM
jgi:hypothetical protein